MSYPVNLAAVFHERILRTLVLNHAIHDLVTARVDEFFRSPEMMRANYDVGELFRLREEHDDDHHL